MGTETDGFAAALAEDGDGDGDGANDDQRTATYDHSFCRRVVVAPGRARDVRYRLVTRYWDAAGGGAGGAARAAPLTWRAPTFVTLHGDAVTPEGDPDTGALRSGFYTAAPNEDDDDDDLDGGGDGAAMAVDDRDDDDAGRGGTVDDDDAVDADDTTALAEGEEQRFKLWHGTSWKKAQLILQNGFIPSDDGQLGEGVYLARNDKALRFARDHRRKGGAEGGLVEVRAFCFSRSRWKRISTGRMPSS